MGNCVFRGFGGVDGEVIKVITSNGGIMEFYTPITVESITNEFPGFGIYKTPISQQFSTNLPPLLHNEELLVGELYYLLPLYTGTAGTKSTTTSTPSVPTSSIPSSFVTPYRMSFDFNSNNHQNHQGVLRRSESEVIRGNSSSSYNQGFGGFWKVKLVISPEQLSEILSQETSTEALVQSVRTVAKCGSGGKGNSNSNNCSSSLASSDQWSLSSSWKGSSGENF